MTTTAHEDQFTVGTQTIEVEMSRYTLRWIDGPVPVGTKLYASPIPAPAAPDKREDELAMLIRRLVHRLNKALPDNDIGRSAMDYLARNGIDGEILRGGDDRCAAAPAPSVPDCLSCANRGRVNGLSQESFCESCVYEGRGWRKDHYLPNSVSTMTLNVADSAKRRCEACAILPCSCK